MIVLVRQTDSSGNITCSIIIPATATTDGVYQIELTDGTSTKIASYTIFSAGGGTFALNLDVNNVTLAEPSETTLLEVTRATGTVILTGGSSGSVDGITVNGVQIMSGAENFVTDLDTTAANVAANINAFTSSPNYTATSSSDTITISDTGNDPSTSYGFTVISSSTTITTSDGDLTANGDFTNVLGQLIVTYSKLGTFTESVTVTAENVPFGVTAYYSTDTFSTFSTSPISLSSPATKLYIKFVPDDFSPIGFLPVTITGESDSTSIFQYGSVDLLIPTPNEFSGIDYGGDFVFYDLIMSNTSSAKAGDVINVSGLVSIGGTACSATGFDGDNIVVQMFDPTNFTLDTLVEVGGDITIKSDCTFSGQVKLESNLLVGQYNINVHNDDYSLFTTSTIQIIDGNTNFTVSGPDYIDWFAAGSTSLSKNITVDVLSGKNLSACSATPGATVSVFGLPSGVSASLDGGTASQFPTKTTDISAGGIDTISLQFVAAPSAFPDWFEAYVEVECGTEFASLTIQSGILYDDAFFQYDDGISGYDYYGGTVSVTPFSNNPGDSVTIDASNFTAGDGVEFEVYSYQLSNGFKAFAPSGVTFDDAGSGNGKASIPFVIPSAMTAPGIYSIDVFDDSGKFGFGEFEIVSSTDTFSLSTSPSYLGGIQKPTSATPTTSDIITIKLKALSGKNPGSVTLELFGIPTGVTATLNRGETNETTITATDQFTKSMTVTLGVGETKTVTLDYEVSQETVSSFGIVDVIATLASNSSVEKVAFADFEIVGNSSYYTQFNFGFVSATPFSVSPGEQITITNSGFTANSGAQIFMGFDLQGDPFEIAFPSVSGGLFDSNGAKTVTVTVPSFCTASTGTLNVDDKCLAGPGFYPIDVSSAAGFVSLTSGTSSVDQISVNSVNIMSGSVAFDTDLDTTATNVATNINAHTSTPNYDAAAIGSIITITPKTTLGTDFNGFAVVSTTSNGKTDTNFVHQTGFADFEVKATTSSLSLDSPEVISSLTQGTSNDGIADLTIKLSALSGSNPDSTTLSLFGLPSEVTPYVSTDGGKTYTAKTTSVMAIVTVPPGGEKTIKIDFAVSSSASSSFLPLYVEADPLNGDTVGQPVDLSIVPSSADAAVFGVATVSVDPFAAKENDLITLSMSGFTANERPRIYIAGVEFCDSIGADPDNHATCSDSGNTELSDDTKFNANGALNQLAIKVPNLTPDAPGLYDITVQDESGRFGSTLFEVLSATNDFNLNVSPAFIDPVEQGESSSAISINTSAVKGKNPGTVTLKVFGLPPEIDTTIAGTLVSNTVRTGTGVDITLDIGASKTTSLVISPTTSVAPGLYFMTIEASSSNSLQFFDTAVEVLPGGNIDLAAFETISINPKFGEVGDIINVKASGFTPSALVILKIAGGADLATGTTAFSSTGTFSTSVKIPTGIDPGLYTVKISDGTKDATEFVEVLPSGTGFILSVSPDSLPPIIQGTTTGDIKVKVSSPIGVDAAATTIKVFGLPPDATVKFDGVTGTSKSLDPGVGGTVSTIVNIVTATTTPPGFYGLTIEANDGTTFSGLPVGISVSPDLGGGTTFATLTLNPGAISPGEDLSLSGSGFEVGSTFTTVQLEIPGSPTDIDIPINDTITVDSNGKWNTLIEIPDSTITGHYLLSVTAGSRTAEADLDVIPEDTKFFDVDISPEFFKVVQNTAVTAGPEASMIIGGSNGYGGTGDNMTFLISDLPLGMSVQLQKSSGTEIVTYQGTLQGNAVTKGGSAATLGTDDKLTGGTDILPGKQTTFLAKFGASSNAPIGSYQVFIGAEDTGLDDISGRPITVEIKPTPPSTRDPQKDLVKK